MRAKALFSVKNVSTFFIKVDATACGQQNGHDRFVGTGTDKPISKGRAGAILLYVHMLEGRGEEE
ncbi:hypothetical protein EMIT07CA2_200050 [Brevibacillus sp. IT-7CA2]